MNLKLDIKAAHDAGYAKHPRAVMAELGIDFEDCMSAIIAGCWVFFGCTNVPEELPAFITEQKRVLL